MSSRAMASQMQLQQAFKPVDKPKYNTAIVGDPNDPSRRQQMAYQVDNPTNTIPLGSPYNQKAQVEINNGGQPQ